MKYEVELSDETLEKIVDTELRILLEILEEESDTSVITLPVADREWREKVIPALKIVLEG